MFSRLINWLALVAIVLAPVCSLVLPEDFTGRLIAADIELKDAVLLGSLAVVATAFYSARFIKSASRWLAAGPFYSNINFSYIYLADGSFIGRTAYDYVNGWKAADHLPKEDLIWHQKITKSDLHYRFYERGLFKDRTMASGDQTRIDAVPSATKRRAGDFRYSWTPSVRPQLRIKERISFVVEIMSVRTEQAAFEVGGSKLGFGVNVATAAVQLTAHAPFGHRFALVEPIITLRRSDTLEEIPSKGIGVRPIISPDGSRLTLDVRRPALGKRYWVHYRFEPLRPE